MKIANLFEKYIKEIVSYQKKLRYKYLYPYLNIKHLFSKMDIYFYKKMMLDTSLIPNNNMDRMTKADIRDSLLSLALKIKYTGKKDEWNADCVYPLYIKNLNKFHIKYEIKKQEKLFLKNGDTSFFILKNGRGEGGTVGSFIKSVIEYGAIILIETKPPFLIKFAYPQHLLYHTRYKKYAIPYDDLIEDEEFLNKKTAELKAYVKRKDLFTLYDGKNYDRIIVDVKEKFDPVLEIVNLYSRENNIEHNNKLFNKVFK